MEGQQDWLALERCAIGNFHFLAMSDQESEDGLEYRQNSSESDDEEENNSVEDYPIDASDSESEEDNERASNESQRRGRGHPLGPARGDLGAARASPVRARGGRGAVKRR